MDRIPQTPPAVARPGPRTSTAPRPAGDQAQGLRRLFAAAPPPLLALVSNPHLGDSARALDRLAGALAAFGRRVLVVDAADTSPEPGELAALDLAACVEPLAGGVGYLAARGLPRAHADAGGTPDAWLDRLAAAAPQADLLLLHAEPADLARLRPAGGALAVQRPVLLAADHPEGLKHAYAAAKLLAQRAGVTVFDLLVAGARDASRRDRIAASLDACLDRFLGARLQAHAGIEPASAAALAALAAGFLVPPGRLPLSSPLAPPLSSTSSPPRDRHA
jgi:flagellar biosynthesis protein FlhG